MSNLISGLYGNIRFHVELLYWALLLILKQDQGLFCFNTCVELQ